MYWHHLADLDNVGRYHGTDGKIRHVIFFLVHKTKMLPAEKNKKRAATLLETTTSPIKYVVYFLLVIFFGWLIKSGISVLMTV